MTTVTYFIPSISCSHCKRTIESEVGELPGVQSVIVDVESRRAEITFDTPATEDSIKTLLAEINYPVQDYAEAFR